MGRIIVKGTFNEIWQKLKDRLNNKYKNGTTIVVSISDAFQIDTLTPLSQIITDYPNLNYEIEFQLSLSKYKYNWENEIQNYYHFFREFIPQDSKVYSKIKLLRFFFTIDKIQENDRNIIKKLNDIYAYKPRRKIEVVFHESRVKQIRLKDNSREGWIQVWSEIKKDRVLNIVNNYQISYALKVEDDVTKLRYFLPLWHNSSLKNSNLFLNLICNDTNKYFSTQQFFSVLPEEVHENIILSYRDNSYKQNLKSLLNNRNDESSSSIFPLFVFEKEDDINKKISEDKYKKTIIAYLRYLDNLENYVGTEEEDIKKENKEKLRDELIRYLFTLCFSDKEEENKEEKNFDSFKNKLDNYPQMFSLLIFLFLLRNLLIDKALISFESNEKTEKKETHQLNYYVINGAWSNSKTFAESFSQLIENSQNHSMGQVAYFGMRWLNANPMAPMNLLFEQSKRRQSLWNDYWKGNSIDKKKIKNKINSNDKYNIFNLRDETGAVVFQDFIEFFICDDAIRIENYEENSIGFKDNEAYGIMDTIESNNLLREDIKLETISQIMTLEADDYKEIHKKTYFTQHYGMRWFERHINNLYGVYWIYSPFNNKFRNEDLIEPIKFNKYIYNNVFEDKNTEVKNDSYINFLYTTEYSVLVPIAYNPIPKSLEKTHIETNDETEENEKNLFIPIKDYEKINLSEYSISFDKNNFPNGTSKIALVTKIEEKIDYKLKSGNRQGNIFLFIYVDEVNEMQVEIIAKGLFGIIYEKSENNKSENKETKFYVAVDFGKKKELASEFIRIFAIFYGKGGTNLYMNNVQIAICTSSANEKGEKIQDVNFILAGKNIESAYATARSFLYYDAKASLDFIPLLKFLSSNTIGDKEAIFPFDLFLKDDKKNSWFENKMLLRLNTDIRSKEYGCKISNIKVKLGSKINIDTFYEAELLFHNLGTIKRFAYLLALEIIENGPLNNQNNQKEDNLFILGYENYSSVLIQEVCRLLKSFYNENDNIEWMIDTRSEDFPVLKFDKFSSEKRKKIKEFNQYNCIIILPLASTMSTVYKLQNSFWRGLKELKENNDFKRENIIFNNYCLLAIGNVFENINLKNQEDSEIELAKNYIDLDETEEHLKKTEEQNKKWHEVILTKEEKQSSNITVNYLLPLKAKWLSADIIDNDDMPLLQVDKTSTLIDTYFQTPLEDSVLNYYQSKSSNIDMLRPKDDVGYIRYGHIVRGNNHYQFYFDFERLVEDNKDSIEKHAKNWRSEIENNVFNIVISPLQSTNAPFLKIILDNTFGSNLHLLHIHLQETGKESIRTKFDYIGSEMQEILNQRDKKICFYYVDDAVCTGNGLSRAYKFLITLCDQYNIRTPEKFTKVFLLLNRSSYETAQTWVENPNEDWLGVINLSIPSYNTHLEKNTIMCPSCRIEARYERLRKRSVSNILCQFFSEHIEKHKAKNQSDFDLWLKKRVYTDPSYFKWLCEWAYTHKDNESIYKIITSFYESIPKTKDKKIWSEQTIDSLIIDQSQEIKNEIIDRINHIISEEYFLRLQTMDEAYRCLLYNKDLQASYERCRINDDYSEYINEIKGKIIELLCVCLEENDYEFTFKFISYIKVISRDYLAKNYFIRTAIYRILKELFLKIIGEPISVSNNKMEDVLVKIRTIHPVFQYLIFKIIVHRLALMRSQTVIKYIEKVFDYFEKLSLIKVRKDFLNDLMPAMEGMSKVYLSSVKTATMEEDNDRVCDELLKVTKKGLEERINGTE